MRKRKRALLVAGVLCLVGLSATACSTAGSHSPSANAKSPDAAKAPSVDASQGAVSDPLILSLESSALPNHVLMKVPAQNQNPQLPNGCEVTSLSMLLTALGHPIDKMQLGAEEPMDPTPLVENPDGSIVSWGNPNVGFVGNPANKWGGYGIYHGPLTRFLNEILPGQAVDLTGRPFQDILNSVAHGIPVVVWDTDTFEPTNDWMTWKTPEGPIRVTLHEHVVLVVGYDATHIYLNNPLTGQQAQAVDRSAFIAAWKQLGKQAITVGRHRPLFVWHPGRSI